MTTPTEVLKSYLQSQRDALVWKLDGLSERDLRRPLTPTGTNLLGIVKHVASVETGYLCECFGRPAPFAMPWLADDAEDNADMWATAKESREQILDMYAAAWAADDAAIDELGLEAEGRVPWWPAERNPVTMQTLLIHMIAETARHAGQADILREQLDGAVGYRPVNDNMPPGSEQWWRDYVARLQQVADGFGEDDGAGPAAGPEPTPDPTPG